MGRHKERVFKSITKLEEGKGKANRALRDLRLLSETLPDKELHEIFTEANLNGLILGLLKLSPTLAGVRGGEKENWIAGEPNCRHRL